MSTKLETTRQRLLDRIANPMKGDDTAAFQAALDRLPPAPAPAQPVARKVRKVASKPAPFVPFDDATGTPIDWSWMAQPARHVSLTELTYAYVPTYAQPNAVVVGECRCGEKIFEADSTLGGVAEIVDAAGKSWLVHFGCMIETDSMA